MAVRGLRLAAVAAIVATSSTGFARTLRAQADTTDRAERLVKRERSGAGLRASLWTVPSIGTSANSTWPALEAYFQKGLDQHLVIETSGGVWVRSLGSGSGAEKLVAVPLLTQIKLYPATTVTQAFEPFVEAGLGVTLGFDLNAGAGGGGLLGGGSGGGTQTTFGVGVKGAAGFEYRLGRSFGLTAFAGYDYVYFLNPISSTGNTTSLSGVLVGGGLTYRYQF